MTSAERAIWSAQVESAHAAIDLARDRLKPLVALMPELLVSADESIEESARAIAGEMVRDALGAVGCAADSLDNAWSQIDALPVDVGPVTP